MTKADLLDNDERCIWSGKPDPIWFALQRATSHPIFIFFTVFLIFIIFEVTDEIVTGRGSASSYPFVLPFVIVYFGAFAWLWTRGQRTEYLLTNRRAVIDIGGIMSRRVSVPLEHVRFVELRSHLLGPGNLIFLEPFQGNSTGWSRSAEGFTAISDAARVEPLLREAIKDALARTRRPWQ